MDLKDPEKTREYWDGIAKERIKLKYEYKKECEICYQYIKIVTKNFLKGHNDFEGKRIFKSDLWEEGVDFERSFCRDIMEENVNSFIAGIDISAVVVRSAEEKFAKYKDRSSLRLADLHDIPYESGIFDYVYSSSTIDHVLDPEKVVKEFYRIMKPGGTLFVSVPSTFSYYRLGQVIVVRLVKGLDYGRWEKKFTKKEIQDIIEGAGFSVVKMHKAILAPPYMHHLCRFWFFSKILPRFYRCLIALEDTWIGNIFGKDIMLIAVKR